MAEHDGSHRLLEELVGLAREATDGTGATVLLTGDAGMGTTRVVRELARRARRGAAHYAKG